MLTWNAFGEYWEGDAWSARGDAAEAAERAEERLWERELEAMERMSKLYAEMAREFGTQGGRTRRWHSLMCRSEAVRQGWFA